MLAALLGLVIGVVIGGLGGGGGVLTVPALVYILGETAQDATTSSVIIVGVTAIAGVLARVQGGLITWRTGLGFGAVGIPAAALGTLLNQRVAQPVLLLSFAALTVLAAAALIMDSRSKASGRQSSDVSGDHGTDPAHSSVTGRGAVNLDSPPEIQATPRALVTVAKTMGWGLVIGFLTGFLGVGGGFLMVPALVIVMRMPMTYAVGTSLLIIVINSAAALATRAGVAHFDWAVVLPFTIAAVLGSFAGKRIADRLSGATLSTAFAIMLLLVGGYVAVESLIAL
jgi:uncharacterized protein